MRNTLALAAGLALAATVPLAAQAADPKQDLEEFRQYFKEKYPDVPFQDFANGLYAIDSGMRQEWKSMTEFAPYEIGLEIGEEEFNKEMPSGKTMASCFPDWKQGVRQDYPRFDTSSGEVVTLEGEINECREKNGAEPYGWKTGKLAAVSAFLAYHSRGNPIDIEIPDDPRAQEIYERGRQHYYMKRGQLNFACADCHMGQAGTMLRANRLGPALGQPSHFPVYRKKWEAKGDGPLAGFGTLHRRYGGCNKQVRAAPFPAQSDEYKALELFHQYMSNGIEVNGPDMRM